MLPTYYRHSDGAPTTSPGKGVRRSREKFILLMIFIAFVFVCFGAFYYVPDLKESYTKLLDGQDNNNNQHQLAIPPPNANKKSARFPPLESKKKEDSVHQQYQEVEKEQTNSDVKGNNDKKDRNDDKDTTTKSKEQNKESLEVKKKRDFIKKVNPFILQLSFKEEFAFCKVFAS